MSHGPVVVGTLSLTIFVAAGIGVVTSSFGAPATQRTVQSPVVGALAAPAQSPLSDPTIPVAAPVGPPASVPSPAVLTASALAADGIPTVALSAYRTAAARLAAVDPACGIDWALLAGIGRVESDHGRFDGAKLLSDGTSTLQIVGPALNGNGTPVLLSTDGGRFDHDLVYAHAVGPMQFLPSTWATYGADANGDGVADPFNINDAALAAAHYLCAAGRDLRTVAGQARAVHAYNHSATYVTEVLLIAGAYRRGIRVDQIPVVGTSTGTAPPAVTANQAGSGTSATLNSTTGSHSPGTGKSTPGAPLPPPPVPPAKPTKPNPVNVLVCKLAPKLKACLPAP